MLYRALTVANSTLTEERTLQPNRVEELRPMSHPAAGCAAITLEPEAWRRTAHRCRYGRLRERKPVRRFYRIASQTT
jgi:hypothetical protein